MWRDIARCRLGRRGDFVKSLQDSRQVLSEKKEMSWPLKRLRRWATVKVRSGRIKKGVYFSYTSARIQRHLQRKNLTSITKE